MTAKPQPEQIPANDRKPPSDRTAPLDPAVEHALDELEAHIIRAMTESGRQQERVADRACSILFEGDVAAALAARTGTAPN